MIDEYFIYKNSVMALMKSSNIPKDAVILDETEAIGYIWDVISKWDPWTDT